MLCPQCGALLPDNASACGHCGVPQTPRAAFGPVGAGNSPRAAARADDATVFEPLGRRGATSSVPPAFPTPDASASAALASAASGAFAHAAPRQGLRPGPDAAHAAGVHGWLVVTHGPDAGRDFRISAPPFRAILGAAEGRGIFTLHDPGVASFHACLTLDADGLFIRDLDTPGGTMVSGARVDRAPLGDGDTVTLGGTTLFFRSLR
ncbi:MAG: FHA domain-containing protein [Desulfovibrionaceae bacterium]|nr:FHA domain-containing protein [Desulfovibrionaceae bacterium]